jgi:hypothetical protein
VTNGHEVSQELPFAKEFVAPILEGNKTATVRYPVERDPLPGDKLRAHTPDGAEFATLKVTRTARTLAVEAPSMVDAFDAQHGADTADGLVEGLNTHYDAEIGPDTLVKVIVFEVIDDVGKDHTKNDLERYRRQHAVAMVGCSIVSTLAYAAGADGYGLLAAFGAFFVFMGLVWDAVLSSVGGGSND